MKIEKKRTRKGLTGNDRSVGGGEEGEGEGDEDECAAHFELSVGCTMRGRTWGFYTFVIVPESRTYVPYGYLRRSPVSISGGAIVGRNVIDQTKGAPNSDSHGPFNRCVKIIIYQWNT